MFVSSTGSVSIYRLIREFTDSNSDLMVNGATLESLVEALFDLLIEQRLAATILVKLPYSSSWEAQLKRYQHRIKGSTIYLYSDRHPTAAPKIPGAIPVQLVTSSELQRESFLMIVATELVVAIGTKAPIPDRAIASRQQEQLQVVCTFEPNVVGEVLSKLKSAIAIADDTPEIAANITLPTAVSPELLSHIVWKYFQRSDQLTKPQPWQFKDEFISDVIEEFSTPLTHMKTALSILKSNQLSERQRDRYLQLLNQECDRQHGLIEAMRTLLQLDSISQPQNQEAVQLEELVPGIVSTYQPLAMERNIQLGYTVPATLPPVNCP
ncbi:MAG: DICT sensory domain-containing protein, partial [Oscillatoria sp. PMC 1076.18]|nr:DICT sensory domain-containing protein [Oscillatoria sp. PMC 1076.18]